MKRIALPFLIAFTMILMTACGAPATTTTQLPTQPTVTEPPAQPAATEEPATQSSLVETSPVDNAAQVDITLADNTIESSLITFQVGVPYTFVISNIGRHPHNFNINAPVSVTGSLEAAFSGALLSVDQEQLSPGASVTMEFTFPESAAGQLLEFPCLIRKHYEDGMLLAITVAK